MEQEYLNTQDPEYKRLIKSLRGLGLVQSAEPTAVILTGGVSSMIVRVDDGDNSFCAKKALPKLKVEADWQVPVHRNQSEVAWMYKVVGIAPSAVPEILGSDPDQNVFAMQWLAPDRYPVWKQLLLDGEVSESFADKVGYILACIHAKTAGDQEVASEFANDSDFNAIRLDPYLRATALVHPSLEKSLLTLSKTAADTRLVLIHGDVSPKNILAGPDGPVFLDAECATYGDPAFDLAFCLNHLLLKAVHCPANAHAFADSFKALAESYLSNVDWEPAAKLEARTAALLPALALARVDGKSPVEYLSEASQQLVRLKAIPLIEKPVSQIDELLKLWRESIA